MVETSKRRDFKFPWNQVKQVLCRALEVDRPIEFCSFEDFAWMAGISQAKRVYGIPIMNFCINGWNIKAHYLNGFYEHGGKFFAETPRGRNLFYEETYLVHPGTTRKGEGSWEKEVHGTQTVLTIAGRLLSLQQRFPNMNIKTDVLIGGLPVDQERMLNTYIFAKTRGIKMFTLERK